jgi:hypothetical protein
MANTTWYIVDNKTGMKVDAVYGEIEHARKLVKEGQHISSMNDYQEREPAKFKEKGKGSRWNSI